MHPIARLALVVAVLFAGLGSTSRARAADPIDPKAVPDALKPWTGWVLDGKESHACPQFLGQSDLSRCAWPSRLSLTLEERGGRFEQRWHVDAKAWVPLPGDEKRWPVDVKVDAKG